VVVNINRYIREIKLAKILSKIGVNVELSDVAKALIKFDVIIKNSEKSLTKNGSMAYKYNDTITFVVEKNMIYISYFFVKNLAKDIDLQVCLDYNKYLLGKYFDFKEPNYRFLIGETQK
jgi:hypothetical protein